MTLPGSADAQALRGAANLSPGAIADSQAVIRTLDARLRQNPSDAAALHRMGMIAWALRDRARAGNAPKELDAGRWSHVADSALKAAADLVPGNAYYRISVAKFYYSTGHPAANAHFSKALDAARKGTDSLTRSEAAVAVAQVPWRRFDTMKNRRMALTADDVGRSISDAMQPVARHEGSLAALAGGADGGGASFEDAPQQSWKQVAELLQRITMPLPSDMNGAADYERASELFREAYAHAPTNQRAFHSVAMVLADSSRWKELEVFSRTHLARIPWDGKAWMALGLAKQRQRDALGAGAAFDSAMTYIAPEERARLDRIERILPPEDSTRLARSAPGIRAETWRAYWRFADPLWAREGNQSRTEFLARVTFAELRWTVDELGVLGADTDRGDVHIRYGPADIIAAIHPKASIEGNDIVTFWLYKSGLMFSFSSMPMYGTARTPIHDVAMASRMKQAQPVRWDNINDATVDSMPVQVARFRGREGKVDVLVAANPPVAAIAAASDVKEPVLSTFWLLKDGTSQVYRDSSSLAAPRLQNWTQSLVPGTYMYRAEASAPGSLKAARATAPVVANADSVSGFMLSGFGISDLLVATSTITATGPGRWAELGATPLVGSIARGANITLLWENYELGQRESTTQYAVSISLARERPTAARIAAQILGALASAVRIDRQPDRIVMGFDRTGPASPAFADHVQIALGETPAGLYTVTVEVTDKATGKSARRTTMLVIRN